MKVSDADILMLPGLAGTQSDHWINRWQERLSTARIIKQEWLKADRKAWVDRIVAAVEEAERPVVLVAHAMGVIAAVHAVPEIGNVRGAFLVAPSDWDRPDLPPGVEHDMSPVPLRPLPFPSALVASRTDPYCAFGRAQEFAAAWGSIFLDAGEAGHINAASGHGPWPEGLMSFAGFLSKLT